ncbi:MAG: alpha/beta fold hydrolase [Patescibacteria group bacterium]
MNLIKTKSFELATISQGDKNAKHLALLIPGRLDTKDYANFLSHLEILSRKGFLAVAFDPPGTWDSPGETDICTTTNYIKAIEELIKYFGNRPTLLLGHSRGGAVSMLASSNPSVEGVILIMASYGNPTLPSEEAKKQGFDIFYRDISPGSFKTSEQRKFILPLSYWKDAEQYDPVSSLKSFQGPKLLIYGTNDKFTSEEKVRTIYGALSEPKMIKEVDSIHDYRLSQTAIKEVDKAIEYFLDNYISSN